MIDTEIIWAAGFFDGEGTVGYYWSRRYKRYVAAISVSNTDLDMIKRFWLAVDGVGRVRMRADGLPQRKIAYLWQACSKKDLITVIEQISTHCTSSKKKQLDAILIAIRETTTSEERDYIAAKIKALKNRPV